MITSCNETTHASEYNNTGASIDAYRDIFHINWVKNKDIGQLLTAQTYRSEIIDTVHTIKSMSSWKTLKETCNGKIIPGRGPEYSSSGVPCIKTKNVKSILIDSSIDDFVSAEYAKSNIKLRIPFESILMNLSGAGSLGRTGVYLKKDLPMTNQHLVRFEISPPNDAAYIATFLSTWWGERLIEQGISGSTGQLWINQDQIREIPIPLVNENIQLAIGNKIRKANTLYEFGLRSIDSAQSMIKENIDINILVDKNILTNWTSNNFIENARLDSEYYQQHYLELEQQIHNFILSGNKCSKLVDLIIDGSYGVLPSSDHYSQGSLPLIRAQNLTEYILETRQLIYVPESYYNKKAIVRHNDLLLEVKGEISGGTICPAHADGYLINGSIYRARLIDSVNNYYVLAILLSPIGVLQKKRAAANSIISYLSLDFLNNIKIPRLDEALENEIGSYVKKYSECIYEMNSLVEEAKKDVGMLITGKLDEGELLNRGRELQVWLDNNPSPSISRRDS